jgi:putative ABC transport system permease protein
LIRTRSPLENAGMLRFALRNLFSRPLRSLLALLGLTVAIAGMVGLFSIAAGLERMVGKAFGRAPGLVAMQRGALIPLFSRMPKAWSKEIESLPGVRICRPELWARIQMLDGQVVFNPPRFLFGADLPATLKLGQTVYRDDIRAGRFLSEADAGTSACVISRQVAKELKKGVGDTIRIDGFEARVVGVFDTGSVLLDMAIVMRDRDVRAIARLDEQTVNAIYIEPETGVSATQLMEEIRQRFRGRGTEGASDGAEANVAGNAISDIAKSLLQSMQPATGEKKAGEPEEGIDVRTARDWGNRLMEFNSDLDLFLWLMTLIGVVIALLSILNTMLMSVSERLIEFGVLKANGWTRWNILQLITLESAALGCCGGLLGCGTGWAGTFVLNTIYETKLNLYASPRLLLFSLAFSMVLGMIGGLYPALWAVRMSPMEAIRRG